MAGELKDAEVLVTGGAGFIGSHLVDELLRSGARVRVLDDFSTGHRENLAHARDRLELIEGDIRDRAVCDRACRGASLVFHQAALGSVPRSMTDPGTTIDINVGGTANVFAAARDAGARRVVYASSSSVYGSSERLPKREGEEGDPLSPYALSKWMNEELAAVFWRCFSLEVVGLRYFNVYGPRQDPNGPYAAVVPRFFQAYADGVAPVIFGDGEQSRDFTFVADAVRANLRAAVAPREACGAAYNVGTGSTITVNELARRIGASMGSTLAAEHRPEREGDIRFSRADVSRAHAALGWAPEVGIDDGIAATRRAVGGTSRRVAGSGAP